MSKRTKKWMLDTINAEIATDQAMERILRRDGRRAFADASGDFLSGFAATIAHMDGGPKRLLGMLRRLERMYAKTPAIGQLPKSANW